MLDHEGEFFKVRGPLNLVRSQQGHPVIFQAGDSDQGRDLGASVGEGIFTFAPDIPSGQAFYADIKGRARDTFGRDPDHLVVMPARQDRARRHRRGGPRDRGRRQRARPHLPGRASRSSAAPFGWHDFTQYDLDAPFPPGGARSTASARSTPRRRRSPSAPQDHGWTLRQAVEATRHFRKSEFVGTAETVADKLVEWWDARACDGFNIGVDHPANFRRVVDELVPVLQDRGVYRRDYDTETLRGHLGLPVPVNRHAAGGFEARA